MTVNQYALLINVAREKGLSRTELAQRLGMERTTLTRNLQPILRRGWLKEDRGEDRRAQLLSITPEGKRNLKKGYKCWADAQQEFAKRLGDAPAESLLSTLAEATRAGAGKRS
jgi:DNA-binding MarR family transcriptional regulator